LGRHENIVEIFQLEDNNSIKKQKTWNFSSKVVNLMLSKDESNKNIILVSLQDGAINKLLSDGSCITTTAIYPFSAFDSYLLKNNTDIKSKLIASASWDGMLRLQDLHKIIWELDLSDSLFSLAALDITGDGKDEIIACSWDGVTYIVNNTKQVLCYKYPESLTAFCAGYYSITPGISTPVLIYVKPTRIINIYYNMAIDSIVNEDIHPRLASEFLKYPKIRNNKESINKVEQTAFLETYIHYDLKDPAILELKKSLEDELAQLVEYNKLLTNSNSQ